MRLGRITGLFGTNNSGKSSILQLLLLLKQTAESTDRSQVVNFGDARSFVSLGSFANLAHGFSGDQPIQWQIDWSLPEPLRISDLTQSASPILFESNRLSCASEIALEESSDTLIVNELAYGFAGGTFGMKRKSEGNYDLFAEGVEFCFQRNRGRGRDLPTPVKCYGFPNEAQAYYQNASFLKDFQLEFERLAARIYYLGPLREHPKREYTWSGAEPENVGSRGELAVNAILAATKKQVKISKGRGRERSALEFQKNLAEKLRELGLIEEFTVQRIKDDVNLYQVWVRKSTRSPRVLLTDVGFGVSQILPALVLCYYVPPGSTILFEQPEIHLHPQVQSSLADIFVDAVKHRNVQIIVESHSEHLLRRLQRRIAEEKIDANDTTLYFCDLENGHSRLTPLEVDDLGNISNWPQDFFGDELGEIAAMTKAQMNRKSAAI